MRAPRALPPLPAPPASPIRVASHGAVREPPQAGHIPAAGCAGAAHGKVPDLALPARQALTRHALSLGAVLLAVGAMALYRHLYVEPREWGALCLDLSRAPLACRPRAALLWLQHWQLWGAGALLLGLWAFLGGPAPARIAAVALGVIAVLNYNASWGMLGAVLGAWAWIGDAMRPRRPA